MKYITFPAVSTHPKTKGYLVDETGKWVIPTSIRLYFLTHKIRKLSRKDFVEVEKFVNSLSNS